MIRKKNPNLKIFFLFFFLFPLFSGCSALKIPIKVGIDPSWYPLDLDQINKNIFGYVQELLQIAGYRTNYRFERIEANWNDLVLGLKDHDYDLIISPLNDYAFRRDQYDFSSFLLQTGPTLVYRKAGELKLDSLQNKLILVPNDASATFFMRKNPELLIEFYTNPPVAFNRLEDEEVSGVFVDVLIAHMYMQNLYQEKFMRSAVLIPQGLRLISRKGENQLPISQFNRMLEKLKKEKKLLSLQKKWGLEI